ncbi:MAG TPA: IPT/TIG domain-containing protein [Candidatus Rifleibacterium sp.]|nr:IPT/TIG domain-containing protein [Candidatus Rifleibacterium sp.]
MKKIIIVCLLAISTLTIFGCGGGGGSSSTPATNTIVPTIGNIDVETTSNNTVATITGSGFGADIASSYVTYDNQKYKHNNWVDNKITVTVPFNSVDIQKFRVVVNNITSNTTTSSTNSMRIYGIAPQSGNPGTQVTISGLGFGASQISGAYVTFFDLSQPSSLATTYTSYPTTWTDSYITCTVPTNMTTFTQSGNIGVAIWKNSTTSVTTTFNLILPSINGVEPSTDNVGATISISGSGFGNNHQGASSLRIGGTTATVVSWNDYQIRARVPDFAMVGAKNIDLIVDGKTYTNSNVTFYFAQPTGIQSFATANPVDENSTFTLTGNNFGINDDYQGTGGTTRLITISGGGVYATVNAFTTWTDTQISFRWPVSNTTFSKTVSVTLTIGNNFSHTITGIKAD